MLIRHLRMRHNPTINRHPIRIRINNPYRRLPLHQRILILLPLHLLPVPVNRILEQMRRGLVARAHAPVQLVHVPVDMRVAGCTGVEAGFLHLLFGARDVYFEGFCGGEVFGGLAGYGCLVMR